MKDATARRMALIDHLENARNLATELGEAIAAYLIERALDEVRARQYATAPRTTNNPNA
jgi:hypothetical protein